MDGSLRSGWLLVMGLLVSQGVLLAQLPGEGTVSARSHSGQFIIQGRRVTSLPMALASLSTNRNFVFLEPTLLTVSSERVKQMVWRELGLSGAWRGRIYLELRPSRSPLDGVEIAASRFADGWQYRLQLPNFVERSRYLRGLVQVILMEAANRDNAGDRLAEVPNWLSEGLAQVLVAGGDLEVIIPPPQLKNSDEPPTAFVKANRENPLRKTHEVLRKTNLTLSYEDLCWPTPDSYQGTAGEVYRSSAHLFFHSLTRLRNGRACLRAMVESLPRFYNWQLAFFDAFKGYFERPLDVEKWWTLQLLQFTGRELSHTWTRQESLEKLEDALRVPVKVFEGTNSLPARNELTLQNAALTLDLPLLKDLATQKLRELEMVGLRITPNLAYIVDEYRIALQLFLKDQHVMVPAPKAEAFGADERRSARILAAKLDALDRRLETERAATDLLQRGTAPGPKTEATVKGK